MSIIRIYTQVIKFGAYDILLQFPTHIVYYVKYIYNTLTLELNTCIENYIVAGSQDDQRTSPKIFTGLRHRTPFAQCARFDISIPNFIDVSYSLRSRVTRHLRAGSQIRSLVRPARALMSLSSTKARNRILLVLASYSLVQVNILTSIECGFPARNV